jgi:hypothetical protein
MELKIGGICTRGQSTSKKITGVTPSKKDRKRSAMTYVRICCQCTDEMHKNDDVFILQSNPKGRKTHQKDVHRRSFHQLDCTLRPTSICSRTRNREIEMYNYIRSSASGRRINFDHVTLAVVSMASCAVLGEAYMRTSLSDAQTARECRYPPLSSIVTQGKEEDLYERQCLIYS